MRIHAHHPPVEQLDAQAAEVARKLAEAFAITAKSVVEKVAEARKSSTMA